MSKSTFTILFYARKNQVNRAGKIGIMIRVSVNGESVQFSSKLDIEPELWDATNQKMLGTTKAVREFNALLDDIRMSLRNHYREIEKYETYVTAEKVRNAFLGITVRQQTLLGTFRRHNEDVQKLVGISKSAATYRKYDRCFRRVEEFIQAKYRVKDIALKEVTHSFLVGFEQYLRTEKQCCQNTAAKFLQTLRMIIIEAKNNGWIFNDPFANYRIRLKKVDRGYLTDEELQRILQKKMPCGRLEQVRDVFIFSCFTGLAYIDVRNLTKENIRTSFDGKLWIMTHRHKTQTSVNVPLLKVPQMLLKKYEGTLPDGRLLPVLSNQKLNSYLKEIADLCGIEKNITFHPEAPHVRDDDDAGQRSADRDCIEDAGAHEYRDDPNLCPHYQRQDRPGYAGVGGTIRRNRKNSVGGIAMERGTITIESGRIAIIPSSDRTVWVTVEEIASIFHITGATVKRHIEKIFAAHELDEREVRTEQSIVRNGCRYVVEYYNLDMIIALCFRIDTPSSKAFRRWITEQVVRSLQPKPTTPIFLRFEEANDRMN